MPQTKPGIATTILAPDPVGEGFVEITPNKTLFVQKLTDEEPLKPVVVEGLHSVEAVFNYFKPGCEVELITEDGSTVNEQYTFHSLGDFDVKHLISKSNHLRELNLQNEAYLKMRKQLGTNKSLKNVIENPATKKALIDSLRALIAELE
ncbi:hypothetical protein EXU57_06255 [Segetibacter sp. 3557_3]|uniref:hypothetical protein n=1 Tax=Segetibacter sp. 3557_3 TaxID=2547429 RepID=UPI001058912B|nr:hypothetical protein [Segetibacter sp. 3557_3]TDH28062.1 hypothetical protein EXU57_06255 [Segetibacter sp. 3557_3]